MQRNLSDVELFEEFFKNCSESPNKQFFKELFDFYSESGVLDKDFFQVIHADTKDNILHFVAASSLATTYTKEAQRQVKIIDELIKIILLENPELLLDVNANLDDPAEVAINPAQKLFLKSLLPDTSFHPELTKSQVRERNPIPSLVQVSNLSSKPKKGITKPPKKRATYSLVDKSGKPLVKDTKLDFQSGEEAKAKERFSESLAVPYNNWVRFYPTEQRLLFKDGRTFATKPEGGYYLEFERKEAEKHYGESLFTKAQINTIKSREKEQRKSAKRKREAEENREVKKPRRIPK